jgi:hypothetical protein
MYSVKRNGGTVRPLIHEKNSRKKGASFQQAAVT